MAVKRKNRLPESPTSKVANCDLGKTRASRVESVKERICVVRGQRVMLDHDLAKLSGVATKRLNQQLRRNIKRFPEDCCLSADNEGGERDYRFKVAICNLEAGIRSDSSSDRIPSQTLAPDRIY